MLEVGRIYNIEGIYMYLYRIDTNEDTTTYEFERVTPINIADIANITMDCEYVSDNIDNYVYFKHQKEEDNEDSKEENNFDEWLKLLGES